MEKNKYRIGVVTLVVATSVTNHTELLKTERNSSLKQKRQNTKAFLMDSKEKKG